jgi:hypothetical protein
MKLLIEKKLGSENTALKKAGVGGSTHSLATINRTIAIACSPSLTYYILSNLTLIANHQRLVERSPEGRGVYAL